MGRYINETSTGAKLPTKGKVAALIQDGAKETTSSEFRENMVCVVDNYLFDAAAFIFNEAEFNELKAESREKTWLIYPHAKELAQ